MQYSSIGRSTQSKFLKFRARFFQHAVPAGISRNLSAGVSPPLTSQTGRLIVHSDKSSLAEEGMEMARPSQDVTEAELAVLRVLWDRGSATIRTISDAIYPEGGVSRYATVQKLLERLQAKGCVARDRSASVHLFAATVGRDDLIGRRLQDVAETLCDGSLTPLLSHLVRAGGLSDEDRDALRAIIDGAHPRVDGRKEA
jgi:predicted transcriptional regulator